MSSASLLRWAPIAVVALAILALALVDHPADSVWPLEAVGPWREYRPIAALLAFIILVGVTSRLAVYRENRDGLLGRAARAGAILIGVVTVAAPLGLLFVHRIPADQPVPQSAPTPDPNGTGTPPPKPVSVPPLVQKEASGHSSALAIEIIVIALLLTVTIALVIVVMRNFQARGYRFGDKGEALPYGLEDAEDLAEAVEAAAAALARGEAREAVIACYAAMENRMRDLGFTRLAAESPEELLIRALRAGLLRGSGARRLTDLFREARFSAHPIDEAQRAAAREALAEIARDLNEVVAERKAAAAEAARVATGRTAELARAAAEGRTAQSAESKRGTHR